MLELIGNNALSAFRARRLLKKIKHTVADVIGISAEFVHFADVTQALSDDELSKLKQLLSYGPKSAAVEHRGQRILVIPRANTLSPWSSKATDIAQHCGLSQVSRLERGVAYYLQGELSEQQVDQVAELLHDRMTERVLLSGQAVDDMFVHAEPGVLQSVIYSVVVNRRWWKQIKPWVWPYQTMKLTTWLITLTAWQETQMI